MYWYQIFALDSAVIEVQNMFSSHGGLLTIAMCHHVLGTDSITDIWTNGWTDDRVSHPFFHPFLLNWHFALYKSVHGMHGACLIGYLCTYIFAPFIRVDKFRLWIIYLFDLCGS